MLPLRLIPLTLFSIPWIFIGCSQPLPPKDPKTALSEIQQIIVETSRKPPNAQASAIYEVERILDAVDTSATPQNREALDTLIALTEHRVQAQRLKRKPAAARSYVDQCFPKLQACPGLDPESTSIFHTRLLILRQDISFADQAWTDLNTTLAKLHDHADHLGATSEGAKQLANLAIQSIRYLASADRSPEIEKIGHDYLSRLQRLTSLSPSELALLQGRILDHGLIFASSEIAPPTRVTWLEQAGDIVSQIQDDSDPIARSVTGSLLAHRANLITDPQLQSACWNAYHAWLRRDSYAVLQNFQVSSQFINSQSSYLNRLDAANFPSQLLRVQLLLDELQATPNPTSTDPSRKLTSNADLATSMRDQLRRGISIRMAALKRPAIMSDAPKLSFRRIDNGEVGSLEQFRGQVIVLEFWNPSCGACLAGFPWMSEYHRTHQDQGLVVIGCTYEEAPDPADAPNKKPDAIEGFRQFLAKRQVNYPMVLANDASVLQTFGITAMPSLVVINRQGTIVSFVEGMEEFQSAACQRAVKKALEP